jgi:hypothetical protein
LTERLAARRIQDETDVAVTDAVETDAGVTDPAVTLPAVFPESPLF